MQINGKEYKLVPRDQTDEMEAHAIHALREVCASLGEYLSEESLVGVVYNAMYAAAPTPEATEVAQSIMAAIEIYGHMRYRIGCVSSTSMEELGEKCAAMLAELRSQIDAAIATGGEE